MELGQVIDTSATVAATRSRTAKVEALSTLLRQTGPDEAEVVTDYLAGRLPQRTVGIGWRRLRDLPPPAESATLTVREVDTALERIKAMTGQGSAGARAAAVVELFTRATAREQSWLVGLLTGELRQGAGDGVILQAVAHAVGVPQTPVRRAVMLAGFAGPVAAAALAAVRTADGDPAQAAEEALARFALVVGRPLRPMLAGSAPRVEDTVDGTQPVVVETKLDGIRLQAHKEGGRVRLFTRTLEEVTDRMPEVVEAVRALPTGTAVLDGEVIALTPDGRPEPFQVTGARTASTADPGALREKVPLTSYFFDLLHHDGRDLVDEPGERRWELLAQVAPDLLVPRVVTDDPAVAVEFLAAQVAAGHEGVVVKAPGAPYAAGRRGAGWVKVKPRHTLDLVVLAVEWGSGRRRGLLSNIHLGARHPVTGEPVMVGKTFKGMTDAVLAWQTERFLELETHREGHVVHVRPEQVVEIAYDGVQRSRRYPGGVALRFARVVRYRDDKPVGEIDVVPATARE